MIQLRDVRVTLSSTAGPVEILRGVTLDVDEGSSVSVVGLPDQVCLLDISERLIVLRGDVAGVDLAHCFAEARVDVEPELRVGFIERHLHDAQPRRTVVVVEIVQIVAQPVAITVRRVVEIHRVVSVSVGAEYPAFQFGRGGGGSRRCGRLGIGGSCLSLIRRISVGGSMARVAMHAYIKTATEIAKDGKFDGSANLTTNAELNKFFDEDLEKHS